MNDIQTINQIDFYPNQRLSFLEFESRLGRMSQMSNPDLDLVVRKMKDFFRQTAGVQLGSLVDISDYVINHRAMERQLKIGLQDYGMSGASEFDNEILATRMLDFPIRDYNRRYFISPKFSGLANLNVDKGKAVQALWQRALLALTRHYGTKKVPQFN